MIYVDAHNTSKVKRYWKSGQYSLRSFYFGWIPPHPTLFIKKSVYDLIGYFNLELGSAADYELMLRMLLKYKIPAVYLNQTTIKMRVGGVSNASLSGRIKANKYDRKAWELNGLKPYWFTLYLKPLRKLKQFLFKKLAIG